MAWTALGDEILCPKQSAAKTVITVTAFTTPLSIAISCAEYNIVHPLISASSSPSNID